MTATQSAPYGLPPNLVAVLRATASWSAKAMLAMAIILAAGIIAVATATVGLALALVALVMRMVGSHHDRAGLQPHAEGSEITLEARKTPRGWTVE